MIEQPIGVETALAGWIFEDAAKDPRSQASKPAAVRLQQKASPWPSHLRRRFLVRAVQLGIDEGKQYNDNDIIAAFICGRIGKAFSAPTAEQMF
jgi:hypothetical protein